jgi:hypothetical protein
LEDASVDQLSVQAGLNSPILENLFAITEANANIPSGIASLLEMA